MDDGRAAMGPIRLPNPKPLSSSSLVYFLAEILSGLDPCFVAWWVLFCLASELARDCTDVREQVLSTNFDRWGKLWLIPLL